MEPRVIGNHSTILINLQWKIAWRISCEERNNANIFSEGAPVDTGEARKEDAYQAKENPRRRTAPGLNEKDRDS